jgi:light-regulated signal transduction histidine kinase (bacteriophytochrome)
MPHPAEDYAHLLTPKRCSSSKRARQSNYMGKLIDALLNLARLSRAEMHTEAVDLGLLARVSAHELQQSQPERQVEWAIAEPLLVQGDPQLLHVVMENLLSNAWKFTSQRQQARIEVGARQRLKRPQQRLWRTEQPKRTRSASSAQQRLRRRRPPAEGKTVYFVRDNGIGFDMAYAAGCSTLNAHTAQGFEGAGVGLTTVQRIIQRHGGPVGRSRRRREPRFILRCNNPLPKFLIQ